MLRWDQGGAAVVVRRGVVEVEGRKKGRRRWLEGGSRPCPATGRAERPIHHVHVIAREPARALPSRIQPSS